MFIEFGFNNEKGTPWIERKNPYIILEVNCVNLLSNLIIFYVYVYTLILNVHLKMFTDWIHLKQESLMNFCLYCNNDTLDDQCYDLDHFYFLLI